MQRRRRRCSNPKDDAKCYIDTGGDKAGLDVQYINAIKGRGIFTSIPFQTGDFLIEYRGELISQQECETRLERYPVRLKGFMFEFHFDGKLWCVDAAKEHESLGRLVNDNHRNPTAKMKRLSVQGKPHLCLFAERDISPGEEITYNYGDSDWPWRCKGLDEVMPLETCGATSPNENIEEMVTNSDCTESYTKTTGQVFSPLSRAEKHCLRIATVSSLDRCASCVGPVSSSKWLGYECKECSTVWHQSCFRNIQDDNLHYLPKPSENSFRDELQSIQSDSEKDQISDECMSGGEYIPDSQGDDDYSDASIPLMPSQSKAGRIQFETLTDVGKNDPSDTSLPVLPSTSEDWPPLDMAIDATTSGPSISNKDSYKKKAKAELPKHLTLSTKNYCFVCREPQSKISRHFRTHKTHAEIIHAFSLPEHSKERKILIEKMRNKGNFKHNTEVLKSGTGKLKVKRKPKAEAPAGKFIHCMHCKGLYIRKDLWRHVRRCPCKPETKEEEKPARTKVLGLASAQESVFSQQISSGVWKLLNAMRQDDVASVVRNDFSIIQFAQSLYNKHGQDPTKHEYIRQKLREVGRLLLCLQTEFSVYNLEEAVKPANFQRVVQAVKKVSGFDDKHHTYSTPSLALKLGHTLLKINDIIHCRALMAEDDELIKSTKMFEKLYTSKSSEFVSHGALNTLSGAKYNKPSTLPFTEDVQILHRHLDKSAESAICNLKEEATPQNYAELAKVALAQVIVFNRRRTGEVSKMHLKHFNERDNAELHQDVVKGLSKTEQRLCNYFSRVEITGKRGRKVAVLLSPSMLDALSLLVSKRAECGVCSTNVFLFARPKCMSCYRGQDCLRLHSSKCGAKHPEHIRSTHLRKHVATLSQVLNLKNNELDQVADFLGHDIRVHQDFYRLPVPTTQLAKISKLLLSMEKGQLSSIQGKSLDEIEIEDEISFSDAEDVNSDSDDDETAATECGTSEPVTAASTSVITEQDIDNLAETLSSTVSETAPPYEGKDHEKARKTIKKAWAKNEVAAVMRHFKLYIAKGHLATKSECQHCKLVEGKVLDERTVQNIRDFVRNRGIARKRQSQ
ncbi:uncharacterized protein LOC117535690 isoform X1 [Gymnodraco acuticeps]|uniref:Uncharacterized protein LOC117535690 isoform X1 n=1 Tax=Gymnodraco acuticeps TaxID=8218 RepID=A0A6P8TEV5_GYMAC|nr:uncharacterized protein LOC117535690 isoform X1 [Gymnodraco acuticeps]XP_034056096.1 uncharacterized protein LOC117535690 isoform X1 [Gymnodraco acuticeps]